MNQIQIAFVESRMIVIQNIKQSSQDEYVVMIGFSLDSSRWADSNLTYRIM